MVMAIRPLIVAFGLLSSSSLLVQADRYRERNLQLQQRQIDPSLSYCFGLDGICSLSNTLYSPCGDITDTSKYFECLCSNGYVATSRACCSCQEYYGGDVSCAAGTDEEECSSLNVSIAPIPTSIVAEWAEFNATYTGIVPSGPGMQSQTGTVTVTQTAGVLPTPGSSRTPITPSGNGGSAGPATPTVITENGGNTPTPASTSVVVVTSVAAPSTTTAGGSAERAVSVSGTGFVGFALSLLGLAVFL